MPDPRAIAASLSDLEREWIVGWEGPPGGAFNAVAEDLLAKGLLVGFWDRRLNETGCAVCRVLTETDNA